MDTCLQFKESFAFRLQPQTCLETIPITKSRVEFQNLDFSNAPISLEWIEYDILTQWIQNLHYIGLEEIRVKSWNDEV